MGEISKECEKTGAETGYCAFCSAHNPLSDCILIIRDYSGCCLKKLSLSRSLSVFVHDSAALNLPKFLGSGTVNLDLLLLRQCQVTQEKVL